MCNISVILVNYNGKRYIDALFESLCEIEHDNFEFEVVFVDNNSSDDSVEYLKNKNYPLNIKIVESKENLGFAGGNNLGVKNANGEYVVLLNNDTKVDKKWLSSLYEFMQKNKDVAMVNSKLLFFYDFLTVTFETRDKILLEKVIQINGVNYQIDNKFCKNLLYQENELVCFGHSEIAIPLLKGGIDYEICFKSIKALEADDKIKIDSNCGVGNADIKIVVSKEFVENNKYALVQNAGSGVNETFDGYDIGFCQRDGEQFSNPYEINNGCGASIMMRKSDFLSVKGFNEKFFMYYEDTDLSYRMKKKGKIMFCPDSVVRHIHTGSSTEWSPFFTYQVYRNKLLFVFYNISIKEFWKYYKIHKLQGETENNPYKIRGTKDAIKIIIGLKNIKF